MLRLFAVVYAATVFLLISGFSLEEPKERVVRSSLHRQSSPFFLFHLLKLKKKIETIEKVPTEPPNTNCICVPYYLCDRNGMITITDGIGLINIRFRRCTGDLEVCCRLPNITTTTTTMKPTTTTTTRRPTTTTTTTTTLGPVIFPNIVPQTIPVCVCMYPTLCDPNGIIGNSGVGVINPRQQFVQCPVNIVCCRPGSVIQYNPVAPIAPIAPSQQICFLCGGAIQCSGGITIPVNVGFVNPLVTYGQQGCGLATSCCQGINPAYGNGIPVVIGSVRNPGTPQTCYCMKSWMCIPGNTVNTDGTGIIDPRFGNICGNVEESCCRAASTVTTVQRSANDLGGLGQRILNGEASFSQPGCGTQNKTYAAAQPNPGEGKTFFAEFPWMVALLNAQPDGKYLFECGGSMITNNAVLTAAHCVTNRDNGRLIARFGQWNLGSQQRDQPVPFQDANIKAIVTHPSFYSGALFNDIAVVILDKPVKQAANVVPVCVPQQGSIFPPGTRCLATGWGTNSFGGTYQKEMRKVELPIVDRTDCQNRLRTTRLGVFFQLYGSFMCAGGEPNRDTCRGDGGGPLVCPTASGQYFQAGIVSWGIGCGSSYIPAVYTSVAQYTQWIDQQLATYGT